jgi:hypothetical protein
MTALFVDAGCLAAALILGLGCMRAFRLQRRVIEWRQRRTMLLVLVANGLVVLGIASCNSSAEPATIPTVTTVPLTSTSPAVGTAPSATTEDGDGPASIEFVIPDDQMWEKTSDNAYSISGDEDTFAWSRQAVSGEFEFSADVESDFGSYGEGMVIVYGDGKGWTPGCLIFNMTGYWQSIRANSIYDPQVELVVRNEEQLDFANRNRYRMTIRVTGEEASLLVDDRIVASSPMLPQFNREGHIALVKYGGSAPVTFSNIVFKTEDTEDVVAAAPSDVPEATAVRKETATVPASPTNTSTPTYTPTAEPTSTPTAMPTATPPPPFRPPTGFLENNSRGGKGELLIKNGTDADALVVLTKLDDKAVKSAYIRNGKSFKMTGIRDGTYRLYYSKGESFNKKTKRFTENATYQRLDATIKFKTTAKKYTTWEVTLYGVVGGNVGAEEVDPSDFP